MALIRDKPGKIRKIKKQYVDKYPTMRALSVKWSRKNNAYVVRVTINGHQWTAHTGYTGIGLTIDKLAKDNLAKEQVVQ